MMAIVHIAESQVMIAFISLKIYFVLANSTDPDEMPRSQPAYDSVGLIGPPAKRHSYGVSLADQLWPASRCLLGSVAHFIWS